MPLPDRAWRAAAVAAVTLIICLFLGASLLHGDASAAASCQADTVVYHAYARSFAEGRAFTLGGVEGASTGCTSHLYLFLLALAAWSGVSQDGLTTVAAGAGVALYLAFLFTFHRSTCLIHPQASPVALFLVASSGYVAFTALGQTDMPLFMALASAACAAALERRHVSLGAILFLAALARPEGILLALAWLGLSIVARCRGRETGWGPVGAGIAGLLGVTAVVGINLAVTGHALFDSLTGKGLYLLPPLPAASAIAAHAVRFVSELVFGIGVGSGWRGWLWPPVLGGLLLICGLCLKSRDDRDSRDVEIWFAGCMAVQLLLIVVGGWQGAAYDRYLGWIVPYIYLYQMIGACELAGRLGLPRLAPVLTGVLLVWQAAGVAGFLPVYAEQCRRMEEERRFCRAISAGVPQGTRIGLYDEYHYAAWLDNLVPVTLAGIFTRDIPVDTAETLEYLKHRPEQRFPLLILSGGEDGRWIERLEGPAVDLPLPLESPGRPVPRLCRVDWRPFDDAREPREGHAPASMSLCDRLDVGYAHDEITHAYQASDRYPGILTLPFAVTAEAVDRPICEVGRFLTGWEEFRVSTTPGKELLIILRLAASARIESLHATGPARREIRTPTGTMLAVSANGTPLPPVRAGFKPADGSFREVAVTVPGALVTGSETRLLIAGERLSCAYWFYQ
ncbi:MAG TPA: hypothetical protein PLP29_07310 [Candidatus Ozemobacteraceae bacterium]|nr:hypothetical protein [Candidatus Ozemobacteraceae bacterium]